MFAFTYSINCLSKINAYAVAYMFMPMIISIVENIFYSLISTFVIQTGTASITEVMNL